MDIYSVLIKDHNELKAMINELISLNEEDQYREILIENISSLLLSHARAEESVLYNSIRALSDSDKVMHGYKEHIEVEAKLRKLQFKDLVGVHWTTAAKDLLQMLDHHITEEEGGIFTEARKIFTEEEAQQLGKSFLTLQSEVKDHGALKNSFDLIVNLMPPRFIHKLKNFESDRGVY